MPRCWELPPYTSVHDIPIVGYVQVDESIRQFMHTPLISKAPNVQASVYPNLHLVQRCHSRSMAMGVYRPLTKLEETYHI